MARIVSKTLAGSQVMIAMLLRQLLADRPYTVASVRGVPIAVQTSFLLLPLWSGCAGWVASDGRLSSALWLALAMVVLYATGLLHELGHIMVARRYGASITRVRVSGMGAFVQVKTTRPFTSRQEAEVALAGPAVTLMLAVMAWVAAVVIGGPQTGTEIALAVLMGGPVGLLWVVAASSLLMALFNLLPVYPLDGGRFASALLAIFVAPARATELVSWFGQLMAFAAVLLLPLVAPSPYMRFSVLLSATMIFALSWRAMHAMRATAPAAQTDAD